MFAEERGQLKQEQMRNTTGKECGKTDIGKRKQLKKEGQERKKKRDPKLKCRRRAG